MAKNANVSQLIAAFNSLTSVNSHAYKKHVRAKRGTYTEITLPDALKTNMQTQKLVNAQAKLVFDHVNKMASNFRDSKLWPRLLSSLRKNGSVSKNLGYSALSAFEIRKDYPSYKFIEFHLQDYEDEPHFFYVAKTYELLQINLSVIVASTDYSTVEEQYDYVFRMENKGESFGLKELEAFLVAPGEKDSAALEEVVDEGVSDQLEEADVTRAIVNKPYKYDPAKKGRYVALFLIEKFEDGELRNVLANTGMVLYGF